MVFVPTPNTAVASMRYLWQGQQVENTLAFVNVVDWDESSLTILGNILINWRTLNLRPLQSIDLSMIECYLVSQESDSAPAVTVPVPSGDQPGTLNQPSLPNNVTWAIQFRTAARGRSGRGRNYALGLTEGQATGSVINISTANAYVAAYEELADDLTGGDYRHVVLSKYANKLPRPVGLARDVTAYSFADLTIDSQRRRLPGRGR